MPNKNGPRSRSLTLDFERAEINVEARTVPLSVSSDTADILTYVLGKGVGYEILDHSSMASIDLSRFQGDKGGPLLYNHDRSVIIGRFLPTGVSGGKLRGIARFGQSAKANEAFQDVQDDVLTDTSVYFDYEPEDVVVDTLAAKHDDYPTYRVKKWSLTEASMVPVPADTKTGVGRSAAPPITPVPVIVPEDPTPQPTGRQAVTTKESQMTPEEIAAAQAAALAETKRALGENTVQVLQLRNIAAAHGKSKEAEEILASKPLGEARAEIMTLLATTPLAQERSLQEMGANERELKDFSYSRLLLGSLAQQEGRSFSSMEMDISQTIAKEMPVSYTRHEGGVFAPFRLRKAGAPRAAMATNAVGAGAELVFSEPAELIEILRNKLIVAKLGARFLTGLRSPMGFSKQTGQAMAQWVAENGGVDVPDTESSTALVTLSPHTLIGAASFSRQLLEIGTYDAETMVRQDLAFSHAAAIDRAALHGTGTGQPMGIYNAAGVNVLAMGGDPTYTLLTNMVQATAQANAILGNCGWATTYAAASRMLTQLEFAGVSGSSKIWTGNIEGGQVAGYPSVASNMVLGNLGVSTTEQGLIFGSWDQVIVGQFGAGFEMITDPFKYKLQGLIEIATFEMADVLLRHPEAFTKATGVIIT